MKYVLYIILITFIGYLLYGDILAKRKNNAKARLIFSKIPCSHCSHCELCKTNGKGHLDIKCDVILTSSEDKVTFNNCCPHFDNIEKEI